MHTRFREVLNRVPFQSTQPATTFGQPISIDLTRQVRQPRQPTLKECLSSGMSAPEYMTYNTQNVARNMANPTRGPNGTTQESQEVLRKRIAKYYHKGQIDSQNACMDSRSFEMTSFDNMPTIEDQRLPYERANEIPSNIEDYSLSTQPNVNPPNRDREPKRRKRGMNRSRSRDNRSQSRDRSLDQSSRTQCLRLIARTQKFVTSQLEKLIGKKGPQKQDRRRRQWKKLYNKRKGKKSLEEDYFEDRRKQIQTIDLEGRDDITAIQIVDSSSDDTEEMQKLVRNLENQHISDYSYRQKRGKNLNGLRCESINQSLFDDSFNSNQ